MKYCEMCGKEISGRGPKKVCSSCRIIRDRELQQKWREKRRNGSDNKLLSSNNK